jgi:hypothetical protein
MLCLSYLHTVNSQRLVSLRLLCATRTVRTDTLNSFVTTNNCYFCNAICNCRFCNCQDLVGDAPKTLAAAQRESAALANVSSASKRAAAAPAPLPQAKQVNILQLLQYQSSEHC